MIHSFSAIVGKSPKVLILGSMPSVKSLEEDQYYGHPRNQFWPIIFRLLKSELSHNPSPETYNKKLELVRAHHIAIWDVLESCERQGSLDSDIKNEKPNQLQEFLTDYASIDAIVFNGGKAESSFKKHFKQLYQSGRYEFVKMPSTSPAYTLSFEKKYKKWSGLLKYMDLIDE